MQKPSEHYLLPPDGNITLLLLSKDNMSCSSIRHAQQDNRLLSAVPLLGISPNPPDGLVGVVVGAGVVVEVEVVEVVVVEVVEARKHAQLDPAQQSHNLTACFNG